MSENAKQEPYIVRVEVGGIIERKLKKQLERIKAESKCEYVV